MSGEGSGPSLQERLAAAREAGQKRETGTLDKIEGKRHEMGGFLKRAVEAAKEGVRKFREKDRIKTIEAIGTMRALPEMGKIVAKEAGDRVVEKAKDVLVWAEDTAEKIADTVEDGFYDVVAAADEAIINTRKSYGEKKAEAKARLERAESKVSDAVDRGKDRLSMFWKRVKAAPSDIIGEAYERKAGRAQKRAEELEQQIAAYKDRAKTLRSRASAIKGETLPQVVAAMDEVPVA